MLESGQAEIGEARVLAAAMPAHPGGSPPSRRGIPEDLGASCPRILAAHHPRVFPVPGQSKSSQEKKNCRNVGMRAAGISSAVLSDDGRGVQRRRFALRKRAAASEVPLCMCCMCVCACARARALSLSLRLQLSEASLCDNVIEWQSAWPIRATTARGLQGALGRKAYCGFGCQEDRAFGVTEAAPGLGNRVWGLGNRVRF